MTSLRRLLVCTMLLEGVQAFAPQVQLARRAGSMAPGSSSYWHAKPFWKFWAAESGADEGDDITNSKAFLSKKLEVLQKDKQKYEAEIADVNNQIAAEKEEWGDKINQLQSEFNFLRDRTFNESRDAVTNSRVEVVKGLMDSIDNMNRARTSIVPEGEGQETIANYYGACFDKIEAVLADFGVTPIKTIGEEFDPEIMEAVMMEPSDEYAEDLVCKEFQKGYVLGEKLIRPAMVIVSAGM